MTTSMGMPNIDLVARIRRSDRISEYQSKAPQRPSFRQRFQPSSLRSSPEGCWFESNRGSQQRASDLGKRQGGGPSPFEKHAKTGRKLGAFSGR